VSDVLGRSTTKTPKQKTPKTIDYYFVSEGGVQYQGGESNEPKNTRKGGVFTILDGVDGVIVGETGVKGRGVGRR